ncbi:ricin-type beta-trefoil lectin domain protein [Lysobacter sp. CA196]|uniref:ricin-type beta-trefoil lectin domain protein n=1 Tax=Lysobacter sp. CA196 TaxID=3455606 RepID=UPI003F8D2229
MKIVKSIQRWGALLLLALLPLQVMAAAPGGHTFYEFDPAIAGFDSINYGITVESDPGPRANVFWANQFWLVGYPGGYTGMQRKAGTGGYFLLSVWGASAGKLGSAGSVCAEFDEFGTGYGCHITYQWKEGHTYQFHVAHEGDGWIGATVNDLTDGTSFKIGSVLTKATQISPKNMNNFTEYWEWSWPTVNCYNQPYSRAEFLLPVGNPGTPLASVARVLRTNIPACNGRIDQTTTGSVHQHAIGNSPRGPIVHSGNQCLDAYTYQNGVQPILATCHGLDNQAWVYGADKTLRTASNLCIDAYNGGTTPGTPIYVYTCHGGANQQWNRVGSEFRSVQSGLCLRAAGFGADYHLTLQRCEQGWQIPLATP